MKNCMMMCVMAAVCLLGTVGAQAAGVTVDVYSGHGTTGGGAPYSGFVGSFTAPDITFATDTGYAWHPFGLGAFGADITGYLDVAADATYQFTLNSDDGSLLFIDGNLVVDNGGPHSPGIATGSIFLATGCCHPFEVQFYEDFGGPSGVDLVLPRDVSYGSPCAVPAPGAILLGTLGTGLVGWMRRRRAL